MPEPWEGSDKYKCPPTCRPLLCTEIFTGAPKSKRNKRKNETIGSAGRTGTIRTASQQLEQGGSECLAPGGVHAELVGRTRVGEQQRLRGRWS